MPLPLLVVWLVSAAGTIGAAGGTALAMSEVKRKFNDLGPVALQESFDKMGIVIDAEHPINDSTLTAAINSSFLSGSGIEIDSVFDRDKLRNGLKKIAFRKAADQLGFTDVTTEEGLRDKLRGWLSEEVMAQMAKDAGEVFDAAKESERIKQVIASAPKNAGWNTPTDLTAAGVANRAGQARYRATHKRTWVLKSGGES